MSVRQWAGAAGGLAVLSVLLRGFAFFPSVVGHDAHDESTYLVIARALTHGKRLYLEVWDTKPPGVYIALAAIQQVVTSVAAIRLVGALLIAATGLLLSLALYRVTKHRWASVLSGLCYVVCLSVEREGLIVNTPIFFNLCTAAALLSMLVGGRHWGPLLAGVCCGFGFLFKSVVAVDLVAFGLFVLLAPMSGAPALWGRREADSSVDEAAYLCRGVVPAVSRFSRGFGLLALAIGFSIPMVAAVGHFAFRGTLDEFLHVVFVLPRAYTGGGNFHPGRIAKWIGKMVWFYGPVLVLWSFSVRRLWPSRMALWAVAWLALDFLAAAAPRKWSFHYTHQLLVPLCFVAPIVLVNAQDQVTRWLRGRMRLVVGVLAAVLVVRLAVMKVSYFDQRDIPQEVADFIGPHLAPDDLIYVDTHKQILLYLLERPSLSRYVHPSILTSERLTAAAGIDPAVEITRILKQGPRFVVLYKDNEMEPLRNILKHQYVLKEELEGATSWSPVGQDQWSNVQIYELGTRTPLPNPRN